MMTARQSTAWMWRVQTVWVMAAALANNTGDGGAGDRANIGKSRQWRHRWYKTSQWVSLTQCWHTQFSSKLQARRFTADTFSLSLSRYSSRCSGSAFQASQASSRSARLMLANSLNTWLAKHDSNKLALNSSYRLLQRGAESGFRRWNLLVVFRRPTNGTTVSVRPVDTVDTCWCTNEKISQHPQGPPHHSLTMTAN